METPQEYYKHPGPMTELGAHAAQIRALPGDIQALCDVVQAWRYLARVRRTVADDKLSRMASGKRHMGDPLMVCQYCQEHFLLSKIAAHRGACSENPRNNQPWDGTIDGVRGWFDRQRLKTINSKPRFQRRKQVGWQVTVGRRDDHLYPTRPKTLRMMLESGPGQIDLLRAVNQRAHADYEIRKFFTDGELKSIGEFLRNDPASGTKPES